MGGQAAERKQRHRAWAAGLLSNGYCGCVRNDLTGECEIRARVATSFVCSVAASLARHGGTRLHRLRVNYNCIDPLVACPD